jgi:transposase InsO family protein
LTNIRNSFGAEFGASFHWHVLDKGIGHVYIKPRTPRLNGKVERSHRIDAEEFYRLLDGVVIDDAQVFNDKLREVGGLLQLRPGDRGQPAGRQPPADLHRGGRHPPTSRGPVFFHQERVTKGGRVFRIHKFRTVRPADGTIHLDTTVPFFKLESDPA